MSAVRIRPPNHGCKLLGRLKPNAANLQLRRRFSEREPSPPLWLRTDDRPRRTAHRLLPLRQCWRNRKAGLCFRTGVAQYPHSLTTSNQENCFRRVQVYSDAMLGTGPGNPFTIGHRPDLHPALSGESGHAIHLFCFYYASYEPKSREILDAGKALFRLLACWCSRRRWQARDGPYTS